MKFLNKALVLAVGADEKKNQIITDSRHQAWLKIAENMCRESGTIFSRPGNYSYFGMRNYDFERGQ